MLLHLCCSRTLTYRERAKRVSHSVEFTLFKRCSVCLQTFSDQAELDQHTQLNHPTDSSGCFYIPVERYRPARLPNNGKTTENVIQQRSGLTTPSLNTRRKSKLTSTDHPDKRPSQSEAVRPCEKCGNQDRARDGGRCRCGRHHVSQPLVVPSQSRVTPGNLEIFYDDSTLRTLGLAPLDMTPGSSGNLDVAGDMRRSNIPITPTQIKQLFCSKCFQWFASKATFNDHLNHCPQPSTNPTSPPHIPVFTCTKCDITFPSMATLYAHSNSSHENHTPTPLLRCEPCKHDFPTHNAYNFHLLNSPIHAQKHQCDLCTSHFTTQGGLVVHRVIVHGLEFPCDQCAGWFVTEELRNMHVESAHTKIVKRNSIRQTIPNTQSIQHRTTRSSSSNGGTWAGLFNNVIHQCENCKGKFPKKKQLDKHLRNCSELRPSAEPNSKYETTCGGGGSLTEKESLTSAS